MHITAQMLIQDSTNLQPPYCSKATYVQYLSLCIVSNLKHQCLYSSIYMKLPKVVLELYFMLYTV